MKIRILTFQRTNNCGAALQAYALENYLNKLGNNTEIIDYLPDRNNTKQKINIKSLALLPFNIVKNAKFVKFRHKYCHMTDIVEKIEDYSTVVDCDMVISGSDQVWNFEMTGHDTTYLLDFKTRARKLSYASSYANDDYDDANMCTINNLIQSYEAISVREKALMNALKKHGNGRVKAVWDPTLLLTKEDYLSIAKQPRESNYLLIYAMHRSNSLYKLANKIAQKYGLRIVDTSRIVKAEGVCKTMPMIGPCEFLGLMSNASFVVTNSFHGTAFSIIFRKNFYSLEAGHRTSRIESLLEDSNLKDRFITEDIEIEKIREIDYGAIEEVIINKCNEGRNFLKRYCDAGIYDD